MPISSVVNRVGYQGDGTSAVFAFPYRFHAQADLSVFVFNSSLTPSSMIQSLTLNAAGGLGFTVSGTANASGVYPNGGSVVFNSAPNAQCVIVVTRSPAQTNGFSVGQNGAIPSTGLNNEIDYLTILLQRQQDLTSRALRLPDGFHGTFDMTLPANMAASSVVIVNSSRTGWAAGPTAFEISNAQSSALGAAASAVASAASAASAAADAIQTASAAVSCGNSVVLVNSAVTSVGNAVSLIGSTAYWGAEAQSSALSAFNSQVLAASAAVSAGAQAVISTAQAVLAASAAVSAGAQAVLAGSAALSASNSATAAATFNPMTASGDIIIGSGAGTSARLAAGSGEQVLVVNSGAGLPAWSEPSQIAFGSYAPQGQFIYGSSVNIAFSTTLVDTHAGKTGSSVYTIRRNGNYLVTANLTVSPTATTGGTMFFVCQKNDATIGAAMDTGVTAAGQHFNAGLSVIVACSSGHTLKMQASSNASPGSTQVISGFFNVLRV